MNAEITTFDDLAASRRDWIATVLRPWCGQATRVDLLKAELDWPDIAGKVDADATLWTWAWGRFPALVHEGLSGVDETFAVRVTLRDGSSHVGFPEGRKSQRGQLVLLAASASGGNSELGPFSIDDIASVERLA
jgi:hypothetical protein